MTVSSDRNEIYLENMEKKDATHMEMVSSKTSDEGLSGGSITEESTEMTRAKWLALIALGLSYTTAFQQGACIGAIVKSIDEALGKLIQLRKRIED